LPRGQTRDAYIQGLLPITAYIQGFLPITAYIHGFLPMTAYIQGFLPMTALVLAGSARCQRARLTAG
jgi:hypothetical protein